ncbi:MAG TPA: transketolase C-terminal domain-containing protein [Caulobacteraceae bacterium]|nr:transketolase C-terminal domain-containing protein [Caulobacteraceae bacterium]
MSAEGGHIKRFFREAIARAVGEAMAADPRVIVLGQDVGAFGGPYKEFLGLYAEFGAARVRDTPVAEASMVALGVGAAAAGLRPLVSITYMDFLMLGFDALVNYAAKARFKTAGRITAPVVVKTTAGAKGQGVAHSQCLESWLMGVPGLTVVAPATAAEAYGLMRSALSHDGPVVFVDHKRLFPTAGDVPLAPVATPIGKALVRRQGRDVTIATHGFMVRVALEAAERLAREGVHCEVVDLRSLAPLDIETVAGSVGRTGALVTLEEGQITCGVGAEVAFRVQDALGPVRVARVGALAAPVSSNPVLEAACIPDAARVLAAVQRVLDLAPPGAAKEVR